MGGPDSTVVDLDGALVTPGFVDSHVHTVRTGFALTGLDLTGALSLPAPARRGGRARRRVPGERRPGRPGLGRDRLAGRAPAHRRRAGAGRTRPPLLPDPRGQPLLGGLARPGRPGARPGGPRRLERRRSRRARRPPRRAPRPREPDRARGPAGRRPGRLPRDGRAGDHLVPRERRAAHRPRARDRHRAPRGRRDRAARRRLLGRAERRGHRPAPRRGGPGRRPDRRRRVRLAHRRPRRAVRRPGGHLRARLRRRRPGPRPRRRLHPRRPAGRLPLHRRRRARGDRRRSSPPPRRSSAPRRWCAPGTGSSTSRCRRPRPSPR